MKFFTISLYLILLSFCSGSKRPRPISEQPQDRFAITFLKGAFENVPDEILQRILSFLPFKYQPSFAFVNTFWSRRFNIFWGMNLEYSRKIFLEKTSSPSKVSFQKLLKVIDCFTDYWKSLCQNSRDADFLNQRPQLEISLGQWLSANMHKVKSKKWNTSLNQEGDTLSYILLQRLLLSPYFILVIKHPIWYSMEGRTTEQAGRDFLLQVPIILGKAVFYHLYNTYFFRRLWRVAIERGIEIESTSDSSIFSYTNAVLRPLILFKDIHVDVQRLAHIGIRNHILRLESIIIRAVETGSIAIFKDGFATKAITPGLDIEVSEDLLSDGYELAYICPFKGQEVYIMPIVSFLYMENPAFLPFLFWKTLATQTPNQPQILTYLCSSIPNDFDLRQIDVVAIVSIISPILTKYLLPNILTDFDKKTEATQISLFKDIIKKEINRLVSGWRAEAFAESRACLDLELKDAALFFNAAPPALPFLYHPIRGAFAKLYHPDPGTFKKSDKMPKVASIKNNIGLYFLVKIGFVKEWESSPISCGRMISADNFKLPFPPRQPRKLILSDELEISVSCQSTIEEQVRFDEESSVSDEDYAI